MGPPGRPVLVSWYTAACRVGRYHARQKAKIGDTPLRGAAFSRSLGAARCAPDGLRDTLGLREPCADSIIRGMIKIRVLIAVLGSLLLLGGVATAQRPKKDISKGRHPNLAAAQRLSQQAWERIVAAQQANEWDMQGHAQKAKNLLDQVNSELKLAAEAANRNAK
jgi:hypothetical protein